MVSLDIPSMGHPFVKVLLLIQFLISFKVAFNQSFLTSAGNLVTSEKFLGSEMKCDTSENDYTKLSYALFSSFTTALETLCKPLNVLFADIYAHFHLFCVCIIQSRILNLSYLALMYVCM